jgi:gamma-glutamyltranspeptidase/glutathione hydrolase
MAFPAVRLFNRTSGFQKNRVNRLIPPHSSHRNGWVFISGVCEVRAISKLHNPRAASMILRSGFPLVALILFCCEYTVGASRTPIRARHGMVVSAESLATAAGVEVLKRGGNAIDAAVAVGFVLAVTFPEAGNIGGGGFMLIRLANGTSTMIDFREKAPAAASRNMYLDSVGNPVAEKSLLGPLAAAVPGTVAGLLHSLNAYGTKSRSEVMAQAIELAALGFPVSRRLAASFDSVFAGFSRFESTRKVFIPDGKPYKEGSVLRQPDLARTLTAIRDIGDRGFYEGETAHRIVAEMQRGGGIISLHDLATYRAIERTPVKGSYRGYEIISSALPSAGGTVLLEMLNILEQFDLKCKGFASSQMVHLLAAAAQRSYVDRAEYLGDPDFLKIPPDELLSKGYARERARLIDTTHATMSSVLPAGIFHGSDNHETTHYSVADQFGNVVATTVTLNSSYGGGTIVDGAGFFLNNEMDDFVAKPGMPNQFGLVGGEANAIAPGKRSLSSMTPTIVLREGKPFLVLGARGGSRITTAVAQIIINVIDFGMNIQEAVEVPRVHHQWLPDELLYEPGGLSQDVINNLTRMGYVVKDIGEPLLGRAQALMFDATSGFFYGGPDPREEGVALGF